MEHYLCWFYMLQYVQFFTILFSLPLSFHCLLLPYFFLSLLTESNSFASLILSNTSFCTHCASSLRAHINTCLVTYLTDIFKAVNSFVIFPIMFSSPRPFINCSFSLLLYSLYFKSMALIHNLTVHSWADS